MANVHDVTLSRRAKPGSISEMTVTYKVAFNHFERNTRVRFREYIQLWGADSGSDDDHLYSFPVSAFYSQSSMLTRTRRRDIATDILDEDWGKDEVFAKVKVVPIVPSEDTEKSNEITRWF